MRIKGLVIGYFTVLAGLFVAAALFCRFMSGRNMLPEGLSLSGGAIGLFTLLYAFFVANCSYMLRQTASEAGNVTFVTRCISHMGKKRGKRSQLAVCDYGLVVESVSDGCKVVSYEDINDCEILPFEVRVNCEHGYKYRFIFDKRLRSKVIGDYLERHMECIA